MSRPFFTIVIATYNSEKTLGYTLESIRNQSISQSLLEILVVDGGSTDATRLVAQKYGATVLDNSKKLPEYAKSIGAKHASGTFLVRMDSDEEFSCVDQLQTKMEFLQNHPEVKVVIPNRIVSGRKEICGISANYMNILGDPFSYFVYRTKADKITTYQKNIESVDRNGVIMRFHPGDTFPLADSATSTHSLEFVKEHYPQEYSSISFTCSVFDRIIADTGVCGFIQGDEIKHNCSSSFLTYLSKLKFRVVNNIFHKQESGFSAKETVSKQLVRRKVLFCLYAAFVPLPVLDSIRLSIIYRDLSFLLHFVYLYYVCFQIAWLGVVKLTGGERKNTSYGK